MHDEPGWRYGNIEREPDLKAAKNFAGFVLLILGALLALWICVNIYTIFTNPQKIEVFRQIIPADPAAKEFAIDGKMVSLPYGLLVFLAYASPSSSS